MNCSGNGACQSDAKCACHDGWAGDGCSTKVALLEERCAMGCCGRGHCESSGCECAEGWHGPACNINTGTWTSLQTIAKNHRQQLLQEAVGKREQMQKTQLVADMLNQAGGQHQSDSVIAQVKQLNRDVQSLLKSAADSEMQAKELLQHDVALQLGDAGKTCSPVANMMSFEELLSATQLDVNKSSAVSSAPKEQVAWLSADKGVAVKANVSLVAVSDHDEPPPATSDFGMDKFNPKGKIGIQSGQCTHKDNCNFRGICKDGICYCQKNYYGPTCGTLREKKTGTVRLAAVLVIALSCTLFSFMCTLCCLNFTAAQRRNAESKLGYVV